MQKSWKVGVVSNPMKKEDAESAPIQRGTYPSNIRNGGLKDLTTTIKLSLENINKYPMSSMIVPLSPPLRKAFKEIS